MSFTDAQIRQLLLAITPGRVLKDSKGMSHVAQQDVRAHLLRIFGFGFWDDAILRLECVRDVVLTLPAEPPSTKYPKGRPERKVPGVTYLAVVRLTVHCPTRCCTSVHEDVGTGTSPHLPDYGDAHDFAAKNAVSYAIKRCAINWGDQFGLSLYNKGQVAALVSPGGRLPLAYVKDSEPGGDRQAGVPAQVALGHDEGGDVEASDSAPAPVHQQAQEPSAASPPASDAGNGQAPSEADMDAWVADFMVRLADATTEDAVRAFRAEIVAATTGRKIAPHVGNELLMEVARAQDRLRQEAGAKAEATWQT